MSRPDDVSRGFLEQEVDVERYGGRASDYDADEAHGKIVNMIPRNARVLDVGCGTGACAILMKEIRSADVVGIEPQPERAEIASARGLEVLSCYFTEEVMNELGLFDVIVFGDVLEHLSDPMATLELARKGLHANGSIIVSVPNVAHWTVRLKLLTGKFDYQPSGIMDATHLRWFTRATIISLVRAAGFQVEEHVVSLGTWMGVYRRGPMRWLGPRGRRRLLRFLSAIAPTLFGCQHILKASAISRAPEHL
jgi:methionine biosynthesis protein MetW